MPSSKTSRSPNYRARGGGTAHNPRERPKMADDDNNVIDLPNAAKPWLTEAEVHPRITKKQWEAEQREQHRLFCLRILISALDFDDPNNRVWEEITDNASCPSVSHAVNVEHLFHALTILQAELLGWAIEKRDARLAELGIRI
jgi:hypothetical protein